MNKKKEQQIRPVKVGLALGSGAARGLTHIGVLKAIEEKGIKISYISGCSIGALIGGAYATGCSVEELEKIALQTDWKLMAKLFSPSFSSSIINTSYLTEFLNTLFGNKSFEDLKIPFSAVTADIQTGKMVVLDKGDLMTAVKASISVPIVFSPVIYGEYKLVDGGLVNPTPVDILRYKKMDKVIAVNLKKFDTYGIGIETGKKDIPEPSDLKFWNTLYHMFIIVQVQICYLNMQLAKPDVLIEPNTGDFKVFEFSRAKELIDIGYFAAKDNLRCIETGMLLN